MKAVILIASLGTRLRRLLTDSRLFWLVGASAKLATAGLLVAITGEAIAYSVCYQPSIFHPVFGFVPKPGALFRHRLEGSGISLWTSNSVRRCSMEVPPGTSPLLIIGDSFTEGFQVDDAEHFAHLLEARLCANHQDRAVFALGRSACSVADYISEASTYKNLTHARWVIIQVSDDDFMEDAWQTNKEAGYAYFTDNSKTNGLEIVRSEPTKRGHYRAMIYDRYPHIVPLLQFMKLRARTVKLWLADNSKPWFHATAGRQNATSCPGRYPLEAEMKMLAEAYESHVTLLFLPPFDPKAPSEETEAEVRLRHLAKQCGVHFVSLRERFPQLAAEGHAPYGFSNSAFNAGHWNRYGHQAAADILFAESQRIENDLQ